jgi:low affinity Fe/Cu permease
MPPAQEIPVTADQLEVEAVSIQEHGENVDAASAIRTDRPKLSRLAFTISEWTGSVGLGLTLAISFLLWLIVGIATGFPHWWELVMTVGIPAISLVLLTIVQHTQNHADRVTQLKLGELIRATENATNRMMTIEEASSKDLDRIAVELTRQNPPNTLQG